MICCVWDKTLHQQQQQQQPKNDDALLLKNGLVEGSIQDLRDNENQYQDRVGIIGIEYTDSK
jgi:hypothetical protein